MDDHVDLSKSCKRLFEQMLDVRGLRHIRLHCDGVLPASLISVTTDSAFAELPA